MLYPFYCISSALKYLFGFRNMSHADLITALLDICNLKKEGKIVLNDNIPTLMNNKIKIEGILPILSHLKSKKEGLLGYNNMEKALVRQWIQYQMSCIDLTDRKEMNTHLRKLDENLLDKMFVAGDNLTAADILLFHG